MDKRELETLCNDLNNAGHLLSVMSRSALEQSAYLDMAILKAYHEEMGYALDFVADALKIKVSAFWSFVEDIPELEEEEEGMTRMGGVNEEEEKIILVYRKLDPHDREQIKRFCRGFENGWDLAVK
ncbi:MAG: hypothetical protein NC548_66010 [Lachnospiraceae bacterium]|nr:hypothetical protein [Lachnospiraceae bacterium]